MSLNMVACNDDYQGFSSRVSFDVSQNVTYYVEVADWNAAQPGTLELSGFLFPGRYLDDIRCKVQPE